VTTTSDEQRPSDKARQCTSTEGFNKIVLLANSSSVIIVGPSQAASPNDPQHSSLHSNVRSHKNAMRAAGTIEASRPAFQRQKPAVCPGLYIIQEHQKSNSKSSATGSRSCMSPRARPTQTHQHRTTGLVLAKRLSPLILHPERTIFDNRGQQLNNNVIAARHME
jgi:hypothetical protein